MFEKFQSDMPSFWPSGLKRYLHCSIWSSNNWKGKKNYTQSLIYAPLGLLNIAWLKKESDWDLGYDHSYIKQSHH